jgi:hypothetical protein
MKRFKLQFSPHALNDIEEATAYYNLQQPGLGKRFAKQVLVITQSIKTNPEFASVRYDDIRCAAVAKFPFLVHYTFEKENNLVTILAVYSTYRDPLW